ncbi:MAG: hypothetical protein ACYCW6_16260 [Candidatus Xenobia bacterium]
MMVVHVLWTRDRGWICNVYEASIAAEVTAPVKTTCELSRFCPRIAPYDPQALTVHRDEIEAAIKQQYPDARVEFGQVPTNR